MCETGQEQRSPEFTPLRALFVAFLKVAIYGVGGGGGLVWTRRIAVEQQRWITEQEFADIVSLCQFMPGPNIVGLAVCVGTRLRGGAGALAAMSGFLFLPWTLGFTIGVLCLQYAHHPVLRNVLGGVSSAAAGLLIATGLRMLLPHRQRPAAVLFAVLAFGLMALGRLPLLVVLICLVPISIAVAAIQTKRAQ